MGLTKPDFLIKPPQTLRKPYSPVEFSVLMILDLENYFSKLCDDKNNIKKTSKKTKRDTLFTFLNFYPSGFEKARGR